MHYNRIIAEFPTTWPSRRWLLWASLCCWLGQYTGVYAYDEFLSDILENHKEHVYKEKQKSFCEQQLESSKVFLMHLKN